MTLLEKGAIEKGSSSSERVRLLQPLLPRPQKGWRPPAHPRSQTPESRPHEEVVQDDHAEADPLADSHRGLVLFSGPERRILSHPDTDDSWDSPSREWLLSTRGPSLWAVSGPPHFYEVHGRGSFPSKKDGNPPSRATPLAHSKRFRECWASWPQHRQCYSWACFASGPSNAGWNHGFPPNAWRHERLHIRVSQACVTALAPWKNPRWMEKGVAMGMVCNRKLSRQMPPTQVGGALCEGKPTFGHWSKAEKGFHINCLEMLAVCRACQFFLPDLIGRHVLIRSDNMSVVSYINHQGRCLLEAPLEWAQLNLRSLRAAHLPGRLNQGADMWSRSNVPSEEWMLHPRTVRMIWKTFGKSEVDFSPPKAALTVAFHAPIAGQSVGRDNSVVRFLREPRGWIRLGPLPSLHGTCPPYWGPWRALPLSRYSLRTSGHCRWRLLCY